MLTNSDVLQVRRKAAIVMLGFLQTTPGGDMDDQAALKVLTRIFAEEAGRNNA